MGIALKALIVGEERVLGRDEGEKRWVSDIERMFGVLQARRRFVESEREREDRERIAVEALLLK